MKEALTARMLANGPVTQIIGTRANWGMRVQGEPLPSLTMFEASPGRRYTYKGASSLSGPRVQFDCYAADFLTADALAKAVVTALEQPLTMAGISFSPAFLDSRRGPLTEDLGGGMRIERVSMDFFIWFSPAA